MMQMLEAATYRRLVASFLLVAPRALNIALTLVIAPLFFKLWGDDYSFYVAVSMVGSFASIVGQPAINRYYEHGRKEVCIADALLAYFVAYIVLVMPILGVYICLLDDSPAQMLSTVLFPLMVGALLVVRASYFKFSRQRQSALIETIFLIIKIPIGYLLAYYDVITNVTVYTFYFSMCCGVEIWILVVYSADKTPLLRGTVQRVRNFFESRSKRFLIGVAIGVGEVFSGNIDRVLLSVFERSNDLVLYSFSLTAAAILYVLPSQINSQYQAQYFQLQGTKDAWRLILKNWLDLTIVTTIPFAVFLYFGGWLTALWLGRALHPNAIFAVYQCTGILMVGVVINCFCSPLINFLHSVGQAKLIWISIALSLLLLGIGLAIVIPNSEITYIAAVASASIGFKFLLICWSAFRQKSRVLVSQ